MPPQSQPSRRELPCWLELLAFATSLNLRRFVERNTAFSNGDMPTYDESHDFPPETHNWWHDLKSYGASGNKSYMASGEGMNAQVNLNDTGGIDVKM